MDISEMIERMIDYAQDNILIAAIIGIILLIFFYKRPKLLLGLLTLAFFLYMTFSMIMSLSESSSKRKQELIEEGKDRLEDLR